MKRILLLSFILFSKVVFAWQSNAPASMPVEEAKPVSYWWWIIGVILAIAAGMLLYVLIKKDPKKDAT